MEIKAYELLHEYIESGLIAFSDEEKTQLTNHFAAIVYIIIIII